MKQICITELLIDGARESIPSFVLLSSLLFLLCSLVFHLHFLFFLYTYKSLSVFTWLRVIKIETERSASDSSEKGNKLKVHCSITMGHLEQIFGDTTESFDKPHMWNIIKFVHAYLQETISISKSTATRFNNKIESISFLFEHYWWFLIELIENATIPVSSSMVYESPAHGSSSTSLVFSSAFSLFSSVNSVLEIPTYKF